MNMRMHQGLTLMGLAVAILLFSGCDSVETSTPSLVNKAPNVTQLTANDSVFEANPIYSPDGQWILFESDLSGNMDIWKMPVGGGTPVQVTFHESFDSSPFWSPDGTMMVFESERSGFKNIWILDLSVPGAEAVPLTNGAWSDGSPTWSPGGAWVAYESNREKTGGSDMWVSPVGGGPAVRVTTTDSAIYHRTADWSPDGTQLVCESNREGLLAAIFTLDVASGEARRITPLDGYEGHPAWSPAGEYIAFESTMTGTMEVHLVPATGGAMLQVTASGGFWPRWSPDGQGLVYCVYGNPQPNIWSVELAW